MNESNIQNTGWARLDNAGKLYPSLVSSRNTTLFRISAQLDKAIHAPFMQEAINRLAPRFPYYHVHLQRGAFWYYFIPSEHPLKLEKDSRYPCMKMTIRQRTRMPFRVRAFKNQVAVEFSHIVTDGTGALIYFQSLLAEYLQLREGLKGPFNLIIQKGDPIHPEEREDAFQRYFQEGLPKPPHESPAFKLLDKMDPKGIYHVTTGILELGPLKKAASDVDLSVTGFLTALLMETFQEILFALPEKKQKRKAAPIRICIPINLRRYFPSRTMRNFFLSMNPWIDPRLGRYSFEEICTQVRHYFALEFNHKALNQQITRNMMGEKRIFVRLIPSWIKDLLIPAIYRHFGESAYSTVLSNLGQIPFPPEFEPFIKRIDFVPNPPEGNTRVKLGVISYKDKVSITLGRNSSSAMVEREFFRSLRKRGLHIYIDSNIWPEKERRS